MVTRLLLWCLLTLTTSSCSKSSSGDDGDPDPPTGTDPVQLTTRILTDDLSYPWEILWGPDDRIWFTEKGGTISRMDPANGNVVPLLIIDDVEVRGEGGLLGMVLSPDFSSEPYVFVSYNYMKAGAYTEKVVRYTYQNDALVQPVVIHDDVRAASIHNGSRMVISKDKKLFITTGDASDQGLPQNSSSLNGKVLRLNLDGSIPSDNPDPSSAVWSKGHRNAQGLVFVDDSLFSSEHGPDSDDEINIIHRGGNYGWPNVKGKCDAGEQDFCQQNRVVEPLQQWTPTIAVCGLDYYGSGEEIPQWQHSLLLCTLKGSALYQLELSEDKSSIASVNTFFSGEFGRLRDICISPAGKVYLCTSNGSGDMIVEISKKE